jgi:hypothetical protein
VEEDLRAIRRGILAFCSILIPLFGAANANANIIFLDIEAYIDGRDH